MSAVESSADTVRAVRNARLIAVTLLLCAANALAWDSARLSVPVLVDGRTVPFREFAVYVMPGQTFQAGFADAASSGQIHFDGVSSRGGAASLIAPAQPGMARLEIENAANGEVALIHVFVMVPADRVDASGRLNGYRIGSYPSEPLRGLPIYQPPSGFVEVTADNADTPLSPNFRLGQFVSKQQQGYPRYVVLRANLLLKLENILAALNRSGRATEGFVVMSGYRTPWYNRRIGNVANSRHVWGGAADIYIDQSPRDGRMDDLNGDGRVDRDDARWLAGFVNDMSRRGEFGPRIGGLGVYGSTAAHGPFVHVDVRGSLARW